MRWHEFHTEGGRPRWIDLDKVYGVNYSFDPPGDPGVVHLWCGPTTSLSVKESMDEVMSILMNPGI